MEDKRGPLGRINCTYWRARAASGASRALLVFQLLAQLALARALVMNPRVHIAKLRLRHHSIHLTATRAPSQWKRPRQQQRACSAPSRAPFASICLAVGSCSAAHTRA